MSKEKEKDIKKDKLLIVDLEATCWRGGPPKGQRQEIIEVGVVSLDLDTLEIENEKGIIVIPTDSKISPFCTKLTSIDKQLIKDEGIHFEIACDILKEEYDSENRIWASWDAFDLRQFKKDCNHKNVDYPFSNFHINLKKVFSKYTKEKREYGVKTALDYLDLTFEGNPHRGVDDAYNTARIASHMIKDILEHIEK